MLDQLRGMWRFRWTMVSVAWLVAFAGWFFAFYSLPNVYEASARVYVDTNSLLPDPTEGPTASESILDGVELVSRALLTRPNLEQVARETDLNLRANTPQEFESRITGLQEEIRIGGGRDMVFTLSFEDSSREKAVDVVSSLLNIFMESLIETQVDDAQAAERALKLEIQDQEARLNAAEVKLAEFKKRNQRYMPDDRADYRTRLKTALAAVKVTKGEVGQLREQRDGLARQLQGGVPPPEVSGQGGAINAIYKNLQLSLRNAEAELAAMQERLRSQQREVTQLRDDLDRIADVEGEMRRLNQDYDVISDRYQELLQSWDRFQSKGQMDAVADRVPFNVLEPPISRISPVTPDRSSIVVAVLIVALGIGMAAAFVLNELKPAFYHRRTITKATGIPVLGSVSMIMWPGNVARRRLMTVAWASANAVLVAVGGVAVFLADPLAELVQGIPGGSL